MFRSEASQLFLLLYTTTTYHSFGRVIQNIGLNGQNQPKIKQTIKVDQIKYKILKQPLPIKRSTAE